MKNSLLLALALLLISCGESTPNATETAAIESEPAQTESQRLTAWLDQEFATELDFSPLTKTRLGDKSDHGELDDVSEAALDRELARARAESQWVLIDYYADWCVSCKIMEKEVFGKNDVLQALSSVRLLRLDVTADNAASRELLGRYQVPGPPSLLWIGPDGSERRDRRITGEIDAKGFAEHWQATRERG